MNRIIFFAQVMAAFVVAAPALAQSEPSSRVERLARVAMPGLRKCEERLSLLNAELLTLPAPSGVRSGNRIGFESGRDAEESDLWVDLTLPAAMTADSIALVPAAVKGANGSIPGFGFPRRFRLEAFDENGARHLLMDQSAADYPNPGFYPVFVRFAPFKLRHMRLTAVTPWQSDGPGVLALAEILVFNGNRNVALQGKVNAGSSRDAAPSWSRANLVDMNMPLGLPIAPLLPASPRLGYQSQPALNSNEQKSVTLELPRVANLDEIRLIPLKRSQLPSWLAYGFPPRFFIETALNRDFSGARIVYDQTDRSLSTPGQNLVCLPLGALPARFVRVTATQLWERAGDFILAFAEIQAYEGNQNVALGAKATSSDSVESDEWSVSFLTDGVANGGRIVELPDWIRLLGHRRELEQERESLKTARLQMLEQFEGALFKTGVVGSAALLTGVVAFLIQQRRRQRRERDQLRERLARDLHDEIGSNLGSIALLSAFARQPSASLESVQNDLLEIEGVARESADSMRDMITLLGGKRGTSADWLDVISSLATRLLHGVELQLALPNPPLAKVPDMETRRELYLFCKEVLHNAAKHGHPTKVRVQIAPTPEGLQVEIADNGLGFDPEIPGGGFGLVNLRERAATMRAQLTIQSQPNEGTTVRLEVPKTNQWRTK